VKKFLVVLVVLSMFFSYISPVKGNSFECPTPKSLMLHSWNGVEKTQRLAEAIIGKGWVTYTYSQVYDLWDRGQCVPINVVLVSLDDFYSVYENKILFDMADVFVDYGLVMTLGLITRTDSYKQDDKLWEKFRYLEEKGFEIASHSVHHANPYELDIKYLKQELELSYDIICQNLGTCPETYILPYGVGWDYAKLLKVAEPLYRSVVSIVGPSTYSGDLFVLKRISPGTGSPEDVIETLENSFFWFDNIKEFSFQSGKTSKRKVKITVFAR
jgi:hypothetical protein